MSSFERLSDAFYDYVSDVCDSLNDFVMEIGRIFSPMVQPMKRAAEDIAWAEYLEDWETGALIRHNNRFSEIEIRYFSKDLDGIVWKASGDFPDGGHPQRAGFDGQILDLRTYEDKEGPTEIKTEDVLKMWNNHPSCRCSTSIF